jgi:hypothetical protein
MGAGWNWFKIESVWRGLVLVVLNIRVWYHTVSYMLVFVWRHRGKPQKAENVLTLG